MCINPAKKYAKAFDIGGEQKIQAKKNAPSVFTYS
jgi:hypothetical protein